MTTRLARGIIRVASTVVPRDQRARWREEWLSELDAAARRSFISPLSFALGAPKDAFTMRTGTTVHRFDHPLTTAALSSDMRYAWRQLVRKPLHTAAVVGCLVIGLILSIGTFSIVTGLFTGDMPGVAGRRGLARIFLSYDSAVGQETVANGRTTAEPLSLRDFTVMRTAGATPSLQSLAAEGSLRVTIATDHGPMAVPGAFASGDLFPTLRTRAAAGRLFGPADDTPASAPVAVVSENFWRTQLNGRADAIGAPLLVAGRAYTLVGVAEPRFHGLQPLDIGEDEANGVQVWLPLTGALDWPSRPSDNQPWLSAIGRLRDGRRALDAKPDLDALAARVEAAAPAQRAHAAGVVRGYGFGPGDAPVQVLAMAAVLLALPLTVLAIGCANVANLQLASVAERARELSTRLALGATRGQLVRMVMIETLARAAAAVALSIAVLNLLIHSFQPYFPMFLSIDWRVASFAIALAVAISVGTGLVPAWLVLRRTTAGALKHTARGGGIGHARLRASLVAAQTALSLILLIFTALLFRTVHAMSLDAPAALTEQLVAQFNPTELRMTPVDARHFADIVSARAAADGRVSHVAVSTGASVRVGTPSAPPSNDRLATRQAISASWIDVMSARVLEGRRLTDADDAATAMVNARLAALLAPNGSALGQVIRVDDGDTTSPARMVRVVGVLADYPMRPSVEPVDPTLYVPLPGALPTAFTLRVRTSAPDAMAADFRAIVGAADTRVAWTLLRRGDMQFQDDAAEMSQGATIVGVCSVVALVLSGFGLYAVMSYTVALRRREIGVRLAIGAAPGRIVALVLRQAISLILIGAGIGLVVAVPMALVMRASFVARVPALDPLAFGPAAALLVLVGAAATAVPAWRASSVDPISTLRQE